MGFADFQPSMLLLILLGILLVGGWLAWLAERWDDELPRYIAAMTLMADLGLAIGLFAYRVTENTWWLEFYMPWMPRLGISLYLGLDGISWVLIILSLVLGLLGVASAWHEVKTRVGFFHFNLLWHLAGVLGIFLALDLLIFFMCWEVMLVPMYFMIAIWGHENRYYASLKFFIFTQASGLLMLVAILALVYFNYVQTGNYSFDLETLKQLKLSPSIAWAIMLGFFIAFAVKLPAVPVHTWLPDAHTQAPTAGSIILAGILLKTGAYGLLRFAMPLFPDLIEPFAPYAMFIGAASVIYASILAFAQQDLKRLIAYSSISHMGFVLLGLYAWNEKSLQGVMMQLIAHGLSSAALFAVVGMVYARLHTRQLNELGGLWRSVPTLGGFALFFSAASLGMPGTANFAGELMCLLGAWSVNKTATILCALGIVGASIYSLWVLQKVFFGQNVSKQPIQDLDMREIIMLGVLVVGLLALGLYPALLWDVTHYSILNILR